MVGGVLAHHNCVSNNFDGLEARRTLYLRKKLHIAQYKENVGCISYSIYALITLCNIYMI